MTDIKAIAEGLSEGQVNIMRHTLGLNQSKIAYRNYYSSDAGSSGFDDLNKLVELGYMTRRNSSISPDYIFHTTDKGKSLLYDYLKGQDQ
jgi:hypothetical protein